MRRVSSLAVLALVVVLALPAAAAANNSEPIVVVYGDVNIGEREGADGIYVAKGDVRLDGGSRDDVVVLSGDATVGGRIEGDLVVLDGLANVLPGAHITGDVRYGDERPIVAGRAIVRGDVVKENWFDSLNVLVIGAFAFWLGIGVSMAILGALLLLVSPRAAEALEARSRERIGPLIAIGIAIAIALPVAGAIAAVTLVGLPLAFVVALSLLPLGAVAYCASAWVLGRRFVKPPRNRILAFLAGLAILRALALVPILGFFVGLAAAIFGLGLIGAAIGAARESSPTWRQTPDS
ncbi:MAG: hypothetical protein QOF06_824 [Solirubrobacterales bacterium]|jgi:MFS family permease|nr:hypothetical protein [Solirubrobacterales bacterium]